MLTKAVVLNRIEMEVMGECNVERINTLISLLDKKQLFWAPCDVKPSTEVGSGSVESNSSSAVANSFVLSKIEVQSGYTRLQYATDLILQLPDDHDGRNTWLMSYADTGNAAELQREVRDNPRAFKYVSGKGIIGIRGCNK